MSRRGGVGVAMAAVLAAVGGLEAQSNQNGSWAPVDGARVVVGRSAGTGPLTMQAVRVRGADIDIDGRAVEGPWLQAPVAAEFTQFEPNEGSPGTERTEARVLYGEDALYVAIRAYESDASAIVGQLTRRDQDSYSDILGVVVDSYFDRRTAFQFAVNPVGVKHDVYHFDDTDEASTWDAVWDVATTRDDEGWTAEFRIPYSQLRFRDAPEQTWGIEFYRTIARRDETSLWAPLSRQESAIVSKFGELRGLQDLKAPRHMEILPYSVARLERAPGESENPFYKRNDGFGTVGADVKYGVTSDLTLDLTINPDFGQVEADPAQVNLTAFETFFPERRPFFLEGSGIFRFGIALGDGDGANESLFYSRRIGRPPQGSVDDDDGYSDADPQTTILGAWKLSGKTSGGWSVGAMHALTSEERARVAPETGARYDEPVEPLSNYGMVRLQKDFRDGRSAVGVIGTAVNRDRGVAADLELRNAAYAGGVDFRHRFAGERYEVSGYVLGSQVQGSADAIGRAQRSAVRYFQRPDAESFTYDPTRTAFSGGSAFLSFGKIGGEHWRFSTGLHTRSPGFEVNDMGYQRDADSFTNWMWVQYQQSVPKGPFRRWSVNLNGWMGHNYDWDLGGLGGNVNGSFQLNNFWSGYGGVNRDLSAYSGRVLRGGPLFKREASTNFWGGFESDSRKIVQLNLNTWGNVTGESGSWSAGLSPYLRFRPSGRATFSVGSSLNWNHDDHQWVDSFEGARTDYLFARIEQTTVGLSLRAEYAFTPTLSLQVYAEPFVSAGSYAGYKRVADPVADRYADRFEMLSARTDGDEVLVDVDGDGTAESLDRPDFNVKQFRSNTVLRWEYRPGSVLFCVWSQGRDHSVQDGAFDLGRDVGDLFGAESENVFMIKASYWLSR
ncbi:MAG TPA: DUF5916 domain-containing protein [Longimicrobiales bacterium]|nr:DUF5916 domain-containing protein [Longimicrobiales bacterium]